jgi:hypothetical protein
MMAEHVWQEVVVFYLKVLILSICMAELSHNDRSLHRVSKPKLWECEAIIHWWQDDTSLFVLCIVICSDFEDISNVRSRIIDRNHFQFFDCYLSVCPSLCHTSYLLKFPIETRSYIEIIGHFYLKTCLCWCTVENVCI